MSRFAAPRLTSREFAATLAEPEGPRKGRLLRGPVWIVGGLVLLVVLGITVMLIVNRGHFGPTMLTETDPVVLTEIENKTGDKSLDGTVAEGLQIALEQSPYLLLRSPESYRIVRRELAPDLVGSANATVAHNAAQRLGTRAYFLGDIQGASAPYTIHVSLFNTATNDVMSSVEERVPSLSEVPATIDRLSDDLRAAVGEDSDSISRSHNTLSREATSNLDALQQFTEGEDAALGGRPLDALRYYQQAVQLEPRFVLATAAVDGSLPQTACRGCGRGCGEAGGWQPRTTRSSERLRTIAQYEYEMNASGDYNRAANLIRKIVANNTHDSDALEKLARVLRLQGRMSESLQAAQQAYGVDPYNADAYTQADNALIGPSIATTLRFNYRARSSGLASLAQAAG